MTSTTDTAGHPDVAEISDLTEDLLPPSRTAELQAASGRAARSCADVYASLTEIRELLGALPGPTRMPEDVAGRIDAALLDVSRDTDSAADVSRERIASRVSRAMSPSTRRPRPLPFPWRPPRPAGHGRAATGPGRTGRRADAVGRFSSAAWSPPPRWVSAHCSPSRWTTAGRTTPRTATARTPSRSHVLRGDRSGPGDHAAGLGRGAPRAAARNPGRRSRRGLLSQDLGDRHAADQNPARYDRRHPSRVSSGRSTAATVLAADKGVYKDARVYLVVTPDASDSARVAA